MNIFNIGQNRYQENLQKNMLCFMACIGCFGLIICTLILLYPAVEKVYEYFNTGIEILNYKINSTYRQA